MVSFFKEPREQLDYDNGVSPRDCSCGMKIFTSAYLKHLKTGEHNKAIGSNKGLTL